MSKLTHLNQAGEAHMVDVGGKPITAREAVAEGSIRMQPQTLKLIVEGGHKKGDVFALARVAGIMAAKKTAELIPLCHAIAISAVEIELTPEATPSTDYDKTNAAQRSRASFVRCRATVRTQSQTGVEMEALTAVQIALLTIYDMCKAVDRGMTITDIGLVSKTGGKSGDWRR